MQRFPVNTYTILLFPLLQILYSMKYNYVICNIIILYYALQLMQDVMYLLTLEKAYLDIALRYTSPTRRVRLARTP